jgi:hypothetical protein
MKVLILPSKSTICVSDIKDEIARSTTKIDELVVPNKKMANELDSFKEFPTISSKRGLQDMVDAVWYFWSGGVEDLPLIKKLQETYRDNLRIVLE